MDLTWLWQGLVTNVVYAVLAVFVGLAIAWLKSRNSRVVTPILAGLSGTASALFLIFGFQALFAPPGTRLLAAGFILVVVAAVPTTWIVARSRPITASLQPANQKAPFTLRDLYQAPEDPAAKYKWKLYMVLSNDTKETLSVQALTWVGAGKIPFLLPEVMVLKMEDGLGVWVGNQWKKDEAQIGLVRPGQVFRTWVGLSQRHDDVSIRRWQISKLLGTLSVKVAGYSEEQKIRV